METIPNNLYSLLTIGMISIVLVVKEFLTYMKMKKGTENFSCHLEPYVTELRQHTMTLNRLVTQIEILVAQHMKGMV